MGVYVRADDPAKELKDVSGYLLGIAAQPDRDNTLRALKDMEDAVGMVEEKELDSSVELASALLSGDVDAMLLNEAFLDTLEETDGLTNLSDQVKLIHEFYYAQEPEQVVPANTNVLTDSYIIYLSGSDARSTDVSVRAPERYEYPGGGQPHHPPDPAGEHAQRLLCAPGEKRSDGQAHPCGHLRH